MPDHRRTAVAVAGIVLAAAGGVAWWSQPTRAGSVDLRSRPTPRSAAGTTTAPGAPELLRIPALQVSARVLPVHAPGRTLVPPSDPAEVGWWSDGARAGAARGSALLAGHTVHTGGGALDDLEDLRRGDRLVVRTDHGRLRYVVRRVRVYDKGRLARDAARLFSQRTRGRLVVVTCADWDGARYLSNVVVTATLLPRSGVE